MKKHICIGLMAHVDAGKTTLSEALLLAGRTIKQAGRVDDGNAFLDTEEMEKERGITILSKQALINIDDETYSLMDTPGHVDFSPEAERVLAVLDYAILVINGGEGIQSHTRTLWKLLGKYRIPVFIFVNKMDLDWAERGILMDELTKLVGNCVDFTKTDESYYENLAMCDEDCMDEFLESGEVSEGNIALAIKRRAVFPVYFGSALRNEGVDGFFADIRKYTIMPEYFTGAGARVYKIGRDSQGNRLTYMKVTGGSYKVKDFIGDEKINQIRVYSGSRFVTVNEATAGMICAVTGPEGTYAGQGIGSSIGDIGADLEPVLRYRILSKDCPAAKLLMYLKELEEEEPQLKVVWREDAKEISVSLMGEVQTEILRHMVKERFGVDVYFDEGEIVYKETIKNKVEGVGHFEPLRHYAEVHLILEPAKRGEGIVIASDCREEILAANWQNLVQTHLREREHKGVLTGSSITDIKITLVSGRAHIKHTEGGDFRQAVYRAVRHGLMKAESELLEPYYRFELELPSGCVGRAMMDLEKMYGQMEPPTIEDGMARLTGRAPVAAISGYQKDVNSYTRGEGRLFLTADGYGSCHNSDEVIGKKGYDPLADLHNPCGSVFCAAGSGFVVPWDEVEEYMHIPMVIDERTGEKITYYDEIPANYAPKTDDTPIGQEEIDRIIASLGHNNSHDGNKKWGTRSKKPKVVESVVREYKPVPQKDRYLLVDGYNIIFAWDELKSIAAENIDGARGRLLDIMSNYQGIRKMNLIVVFDAYRLKGHRCECLDYDSIHVVYTKEAETADRYIERFSHENSKKYFITVATSDGLEQIIIRGEGCHVMSARDLYEDVVNAGNTLRESLPTVAKAGMTIGEAMDTVKQGEE